MNISHGSVPVSGRTRPCVAVPAIWKPNGARSPHSMHWVMYCDATWC
jgi:hypothetical protein